MVSELLDDPHGVLAELDAVLPEIIRALEHGLQKARAYFDAEPVQIDAAVFSSIVRLHARDHLRKKSLDTAEIEIERVNLCGLRLRLGVYQIKIWKITPEDLEKGLKSEAYGKAQMEIVQDGAPLLGFGLAVFWTADALRHLGSIYLVHQLRDDPRCFEWIWSVPIPHPADTTSVTREFAGDLPIEAVHDHEKKA
jgi:hypothetical protein